MLNSGRPKIAEDLSYVFISESFACLQFNNKSVIDKEIRKVITEQSSVLVIDRKRELLFNDKAPFSETVSESVFVDLFQVAVAQKAMDIEAGFADDIAEAIDIHE